MLPLNKIRGLLVERGIRGTGIARSAGVSPITVSIVLTGKGRSRHIQMTIANMLGMPYREIWGRDKRYCKTA